MNMTMTQENLRRILWREMRNGGLTGMALAKSAGLQQAHISNFLNGKRGLSLEAMDRVLAARHLSLFDLIDPAEVNQHASIPGSTETSFHNVALIDASLAAAAPRITRTMTAAILKFPARFLRSLHPACTPARARWERFIAARVDARIGMSMFPRLLPGATVLIDRHYHALKPYRRGESTMFLVSKDTGSCTIRYVERIGDCLILRPHNHAYPVEMLVSCAHPSFSHHIIGRIAYVGMAT